MVRGWEGSCFLIEKATPKGSCCEPSKGEARWSRLFQWYPRLADNSSSDEQAVLLI